MAFKLRVVTPVLLNALRSVGGLALGAVTYHLFKNVWCRKARRREQTQTDKVQTQTKGAQAQPGVVQAQMQTKEVGGPVPPHVARLWVAARAGDAATVRTLLFRHCLPANMLHPVTGSTLLLDVAAVDAWSTVEDFWLAEVMRVLLRHGCCVREQLPPANDTPMHVLAAQPRSCHIHQRALVVLGQVSDDYNSEVCALELRNAEGLLPGEGSDRQNLRDRLDASRREWPKHAQARRAEDARQHLSKAHRLVAPPRP